MFHVKHRFFSFLVFFQMSHAPTIEPMALGATGKIIAGTVGAAALLGFGGAGLTYALMDAPDASQFAVEVGQAPQVIIDDPQDVLSPEDEERMMRDAERLDHPAVVQELHYLVFAENHENVFDSVEEYVRDTYPELIGSDDDRFAPGTAIVGVGLNPRQAFAYYGDDVAAQLQVDKGQRDEEVLEAMKPGVRDGNIPAGLFAAAKTAFDVEAAQQYGYDRVKGDREGAAIGAGAAGAGVATAVGAGTGISASRRRRRLEQARADYKAVTGEYAALSGRLDEVDIRANSLSSAFADVEMRKEWAEVRDRFLDYHEVVSGAGGIGEIDINDDKQALKNHKKLREAAESVEHVSNAEDNINRMFKIENGDAAARRAGLTDLREDVIAARVGVSRSTLREALADLEERIDWLDANPEAPNFMDEFVRVLGDYRLLLDQVKKEEFSDVKEYTPLHRPAVYERDYFFPGYVTYVSMNNWHADNVQAHERAQSSSSGTTAGVSSSGFTAAGSSSSF